ncbi:MAG: insulinase family protein [Bacteroidales bacterium]|nr:insulinase family protein [Bacteroidales bacterium]
MKHNSKPSLIPISYFEPSVPQKLKIDENLTLHLLPYEGDFAQFIFVLPIGKKNEKKLLQASFTALMLLEGTNRKTSSEIAFEFDKLASEINIHTSLEHTIFSIATIKNNVEPVMNLFFECLFNSVFPEKELHTLLQQHRQDFMIKIRKPMFKARTLFPSLLFGDQHIAFKPTTDEDFLHVGTSDLHAFYHHYPWDKIQIFFTGDPSCIDKVDFTPLVKAAQNTTSHEEQILICHPTKEKEKIDYVPESAQSAIILGKPTITFKHPDYPAFYFLNVVLGGYFGSRLMKNIRETKGYTYGIYSDITSHKTLSFWAIYSTVNKEKTQDAINEIFHEIQRLLDEKVPLKELTKVKNYIKGVYLSNFENEFTTTQYFVSLYKHDVDPLSYGKYFWNEVDHMDPDKLLKVANQYLQPDELKILIVTS